MQPSCLLKTVISWHVSLSQAARLGSVFLALTFTTVFAATDLVIYPKPQNANDTRYNDLIEILKTAMEKTVPTHGPYEMRESNIRMVEQRQLDMLREGKTLTVMWSSTSEEKETLVSPILIPLRKGLLGYRVSLINKNNQANIDKLQSLADLQRTSIGQGNGWGDVTIYEFNGIKVTEALYDGLFKMVNANRITLFPRGINEAFVEFEERKGQAPNLAVEKNLLIYYPWPYYFFFQNENTALKERVEKGVRMMMDDGSFDEIFWRFNGSSIEQANVANRRVIPIENPFLPASAPIGETNLWFDPLSAN